MRAAGGDCAALVPQRAALTAGAPSGRSQRQQEHPRTPDRTQKLSKRRWDGLVRAWRRKLHEWDVAAAEAPAPAAPGTVALDAKEGPARGPAPAAVSAPAPAEAAAPAAKATPEAEEDELDAIERELEGVGAEAGGAKLTESDLKMFEDDDLL